MDVPAPQLLHAELRSADGGGDQGDRSFSQPASGAAISFVDTRDIARVAARVLTTSGHDGQVYDIFGPEALTYDQAAGVFSGALGEPVRFTGLADARPARTCCPGASRLATPTS